MIKLVKHSLTPAGRFEVESCPLTLSEKDSQIVMTLGPDAMELQIGDWLLDDEEPGAGIVYRVKTIETDFQTKTRRVTAEHIIQTLRDAVIFGTVDAETMGGSDGLISAAGAIGYALSQCADWQLGTIGYNTSQPYEFNGDSVLEAIETVCTTLVDPWWSYDLSSYPFTLNINPKSSAAQCEMRAERNIATLRRTVDMSRMYTRIYPVGKDDLHIEGDYLSQNENLYGVIAKVETDQSKETAGMLQAWAAARLARHCNPNVTIQITGADLSESTGEPLDHLQIGVGCRVPLPEFNTTILETISKLQWKDKKADPEIVTATLANDWEDVASIMRREIASGSGTTGKAGRTRSKQQKEDHAWFVDTDDHVAMVAEAIAGTDGQGKPNWSRVSTLNVDGNGIDSRVTTTESGLVTAQSAIVQAEHGISMSVGTLKGLTLETFPKKKNFPAAGAANKIYLDQETGIYWVYVGGEYKRAKFATDGEGHPITDSSGKIAEVHFTKAGEIAIAINEQGDAEAHIDAKKVILGKSELTADDLEQWAINGTGPGSGVFAEFLTVRELTAQEITAMMANIKDADIDEVCADIVQADTLKVLVNEENYSNVFIYDASVASNVLTIYCTNGQNINFSKATSLSATWTGDNTTAQATFAISATQTNKNTSTNQNETVEVATDQASAAAKTTTIEVKQSKAAAYVVTVGASGGKSDGAIIARIDNPQYGNGWAAAYALVSLPTDSSTAASFDVETPPSTVDGTADTETYTLSNPQNDVAVVKNSSGTIIARLAHGKYTSGKQDATVTMDNFTLDTLPGTATYADVATRVITAHAHNTDNSAKTGSKDTTLAMTASGLVVTLKQDNTPIAQITATAPTPSYDTPTITYDTLSGLIDATPGFTVTANGKSNTGYLTIGLSTYDVNGTTRHCVNAYKEDTQTIAGRLDIQDYAVSLYMSGVGAGGSAATLVSVSTSGRTKAGDLSAGDTVGIRYVNSNSQFAYQDVYWQVPSGGGGSHSPSISSGDIWTTDRTLSGWIEANTLKSKYEQAKRDSEYVAFKVTCGGAEQVYYMEP